MNWIDFLPVIIPSAVALIFLVLSIVLKMRKDSMVGLSKEMAELLLSVYESMKDNTLTPEELERIMKEGQDVIDEAAKFFNKENNSSS